MPVTPLSTSVSSPEYDGPDSDVASATIDTDRLAGPNALDVRHLDHARTSRAGHRYNLLKQCFGIVVMFQNMHRDDGVERALAISAGRCRQIGAPA